MLSMSDINHIRDLHQSGYKISEIHKRTGADPKTIRKYLEKEDFSDNLATAQPKSSILDPFKPTIAETARANNLKPYEYFKYLLEVLPKHENDPASQRNGFIKDLLPWSDRLPETIKKPEL